jgi:hypothetical protein
VKKFSTKNVHKTFPSFFSNKKYFMFISTDNNLTFFCSLAVDAT